jgi:hypothetical protein
MIDLLVVYENGEETARIGYGCGFHSRYVEKSRLQMNSAVCNWKALWKKSMEEQIRDLFFATGAKATPEITILVRYGNSGGGGLKYSENGWIPFNRYQKPIPF